MLSFFFGWGKGGQGCMIMDFVESECITTNCTASMTLTTTTYYMIKLLIATGMASQLVKFLQFGFDAHQNKTL